VGSGQRLASYTTLPAGSYTFRVQGATSGGGWTEPGAQLRIQILPAWWSALWFRITVGALLLLVALATYNYRLSQVARTLRARFADRLAERTQVARELHDTLLQTIQGSKMVADDALAREPDSVNLRRTVERLSEILDRQFRKDEQR
jgi:signal transduction histidine kinase